MATQANLDRVQQMYIAYYGRPADPTGQEFWADRLDAVNGNLEEIVTAFGTSAEYTERFGGLSFSELVDNLFVQGFGRSAEPEGLAFYVGRLESGEATLGEIALQILDGAQNEDLTALENKMEVADAFTMQLTDSGAIYEGTDAADAARELLLGVTSDNSTVDTQTNAIETLLEELTPGTNSAPVITDATVSIFENTVSNGSVVVATASATDADNDPLSFSIKAGNTGEVFAIDSDTGEISLVAPVDFGTLNQYNLTIEVSDGTEVRSATFQINISNVNENPTGNVLITGTAEEDQTLSADTSTIADPDGLGTFNYQWQRGGSDITGATSSTYTLVNADVGSVITVVVNYTDADGTNESLTSAATSTVVGTEPSNPDSTVIVADTQTNSNLSTDDSDLTFDSFLNYDILDDSDSNTPDRMTVPELRTVAVDADITTGDTGDIPEAENIGFFSFDMGDPTSGSDSDTLDYSNETGLIAAVVDFSVSSQASVSNVLVSDDNDTDFTDDSNRVDAVSGLENLVASAGNSLLDLTLSNVGLKVRFNADDGAISVDGSFDREVYRVQLSNSQTAASLGQLNFLEYEDAGNSGSITQATTAWTQIEFGDLDDTVELTDHETAISRMFNMRGGDNEMNYNELTRSINTSINVSDYDTATPTTTGQVTATTTFTDGNAVIIGGSDIATSYTAQNGITAGSLRIEGSQDAEDAVSFSAGLDKLFVLGQVIDGSDQISVNIGATDNQNTIVLTGFEVLVDSADDDIYSMEDLDRVFNNLTLTDNITNDRDTLVVENDAVGFQGAAASAIDLEELNDNFSFDFDVLDISSVTSGGLTVTGDTNGGRDLSNDEIVFGDLALVNTVTDFDTLSLSNSTSGTAFDFDATATALQDGSNNNLLTFDADANALDASRINDGRDLTLTVTGAGAITVVGGSGDDTITGGDGDNGITGGLGADTLDGGITAAVGATYSVVISGGTATSGGAGDSMTIAGLTLNTVAVPALATDIVVAADADQIGTAFADQTLASWITALDGDGLTSTEAGTLQSVNYNASSNELLFTFDNSANGSTLTGAGNLITLTTAPAVTGAAVLGAVESETDFTAQADSSDTFNYSVTETGSVNADTINNFSDDLIAGEDDVLDFTDLTNTDLRGTGSGIENVNVAGGAAIASNTGFVNDVGAALANLSVSTALANLQNENANITAGDSFYYAADNGTSTMIYRYDDTNSDGTANSGELLEIVTLVGILTDNLDADNLANFV